MKQLVPTGLSVGILLVFAALSGCGDEDTQVAGASGPPAELLQTGQTACYDANGNSIVCTGTGQDGALQAGVARRYVDNGDGTITDASTGLMWEKKSRDGGLHDQDGVYIWSAAFAFIVELNSASFAGHADWRLPNINELRSLAQYGLDNPAVDPAFSNGCAAGCKVTQCSCTQSDYYWSSTTYQLSPTGAWSVNFYDGHVDGSNDKSFNLAYVRAVRGGL